MPTGLSMMSRKPLLETRNPKRDRRSRGRLNHSVNGQIQIRSHRPEGESLAGEVEADDAKKAKQLIREKGITPIKVTKVGGSVKKSKPTHPCPLEKRRSIQFPFPQAWSQGRGNRLGFSQEIDGTAWERDAGRRFGEVPESTAFRSETQGGGPFSLERACRGRTLSRAMRALPQYFSESSTFVIEAGEATGSVGPILKNYPLPRGEKGNSPEGFFEHGLSIFRRFCRTWRGGVFHQGSFASNQGYVDKMGGEMNFLASYSSTALTSLRILALLS